MDIDQRHVYFSQAELNTIGAGLLFRRDHDPDAEQALTQLQVFRATVADEDPDTELVEKVGIELPKIHAYSAAVEELMWVILQQETDKHNPELAEAAASLFADFVAIYVNNTRLQNGN